MKKVNIPHRTTVYIDKALYKKIKKTGANFSGETADYWRMRLEIPDKKSDLLKAKEEHLQEIIAIDMQLQQHKTKVGISFVDFLKTIEENESYTPELIETIKFELVDSLRIIKEKPHTKITRINTLNSKFSLKLNLQMIEKFLLETDNKDSEYYIKKNRNIGNILRKRIVETTV